MRADPSSALLLVGTPWKSGGREVGHGLDCWGLLRLVYSSFLGVSLPSYPGLDPLSSQAVREALRAEERGWRELEEAEEWAAVGMATGRRVHHVGVWIQGAVLHALPGVGVVHQSPVSLRGGGLAIKQFWAHDLLDLC